jgi:hypothetical protein
VIPLEFHLIPAVELHPYWEFVRRGLEEIKQKIRIAVWIPEDVYAAIRSGHTELWIVSRDGSPQAFWAAYLQQQAFTGVLQYWLWIMYALKPKDREPGDIKADRAAVIERIKERAREMKCKAIITEAPRKGHEKIGFDAWSTIYRIEL